MRRQPTQQTRALRGNKYVPFPVAPGHHHLVPHWKVFLWSKVQPRMSKKLFLYSIKYTKIHTNLIESQHMIVELLLHGPFLVHHIRRKWVYTTFSFLASVPFLSSILCELVFIIRKKGTSFKNSRTLPNYQISTQRLVVIPILVLTSLDSAMTSSSSDSIDLI